MNDVCIVSIAKNEEPFLDEWIAYHQYLGASHFIIYDNDPELPLKTLLRPYEDIVNIVPWPHHKQLDAYNDSLKYLKDRFKWVCYLDIDEFIVLNNHENILSFLTDFDSFDSVSLNWHVFGHNGYYEDPKDLVTKSLIRRSKKVSQNAKSFTKVNAISEILSPHFCQLKDGSAHVDTCKKPFVKEDIYPGRDSVAHINHYQCRSFLRWMNRFERGSGMWTRDNAPPQHRWRVDEHLLLKQFVQTVAKDKNEMIDEQMLSFESEIRKRMRLAFKHQDNTVLI